MAVLTGETKMSPAPSRRESRKRPLVSSVNSSSHRGNGFGGSTAKKRKASYEGEDEGENAGEGDVEISSEEESRARQLDREGGGGRKGAYIDQEDYEREDEREQREVDKFNIQRSVESVGVMGVD